ncbi:MAG: carboxypeptidase-like regulatory domain-containing protein, partial [Cyclobacteriaceae bacterium]|nr:carboxypeptidase-like regulatory domain-containing protein [Cyclobacteriaceae bacterium]
MKLIYLILLLVLTTGVTAQTKISGSVKDERGELIPGANVLIQDSYDGTSTGVNGAFTFVTEETGTQTLIVTFVGYKPYSQTLELSGNEIEIQIS